MVKSRRYIWISYLKIIAAIHSGVFVEDKSGKSRKTLLVETSAHDDGVTDEEASVVSTGGKSESKTLASSAVGGCAVVSLSHGFRGAALEPTGFVDWILEKTVSVLWFGEVNLGILEKSCEVLTGSRAMVFGI